METRNAWNKEAEKEALNKSVLRDSVVSVGDKSNALGFCEI